MAIDSFLMVGQSNMAGRGFAREVSVMDDPQLVLQVNGRWYKLFEPANFERPFAGTGLAPAFARCYAGDHPQVQVGLIPCAEGGSSLAEWQKGDALYENTLFRARMAQKTSTIRAILWHQGEAECPQALCRDYAQRFLPIMEGLRRDLGLTDVPVLVGGIGDFVPLYDKHDYMDNYIYINQALRDLAAQRPDYHFVSAYGLSSNPDFLHFNALSLREFGMRYYRAFAENRDYLAETEGFAHPDARVREAIWRIDTLNKQLLVGAISQETFAARKQEALLPLFEII